MGCKVNQYETEYLREGLLRLGYREAADSEQADLCVVNTCTVTAEGDLKSRKLIRQFARQNPGAEILVMGCYATRAADELAALPGVVEVLSDKQQLPDLLARMGLVDVPRGISTFGPRHRAYVKVQDGCRMECAYCIIPSVRPELRSRPVAEVLDEIAVLVRGGHREIVLTGIHLGHYGVDLPSSGGRRPELADLVERIAGLEGDFRLRISSLESAEVGPRLIGLLADHPDRICPHLHLSMQSGSNAVLRRMRRRYRIEQFVEQCLEIGKALDTPALTTDVIVGFPGETEDDFRDTLRVVEEIGFAKVHVFRYSPRDGTPAAELPDQVPSPVRRRRAAELGELAGRLRRQFFERLVGRRLQVLVESPLAEQPGRLVGTCQRYATVRLSGPLDRVGGLVEVVAQGVENEQLVAVESVT